MVPEFVEDWKHDATDEAAAIIVLAFALHDETGVYLSRVIEAEGVQVAPHRLRITWREAYAETRTRRLVDGASIEVCARITANRQFFGL